MLAALPDLGHAALFNAVNFALPITQNTAGPWANQPVDQTQLSLLLCPSDGKPQIAGWAEGCGWSNYAGNATRIPFSGSGPTGVFSIGAGLEFRTVRVSDIADGTSQTAMACEQLLGRCVPPEFRPHRLRCVFDTPKFSRSADELAQACSKLDVETARLGGHFDRGAHWMLGWYGSTLYSHVLTPNLNSCQNHTDIPSGAWTASSFHTGGVNLVLSDGSVRFVGEGLSATIWRAIASARWG